MQKLPIVFVDDQQDYVDKAVRQCRLLLPDREAYGFYSVAAAKAELMRFEGPFMLILDHDFPPERGEEKGDGWALSSLLRARHPWGLLLPICYLSGRFDDKQWRELTEEEGSFAPTMYMPKQGDWLGVIEKLDESFARSRRAWLAQAELILDYEDGVDLDDVEADEDAGDPVGGHAQGGAE